MKKALFMLVPVLVCGTAGYGQDGEPGVVPPMIIEVDNTVNTNQNQDAFASGGDSQSDSSSVANVNVDTRSLSEYESRTPPLTTFPPYLPYWTHGGWGTVKAYFPNGPTFNDRIYETTFDPRNADDMREIRSVLKALPHQGFLEMVGGALNNVAVAFGAPDRYHHGRGLEIANSVVPDRRPERKPLLVFIDSNVDMGLLNEEGYVYVGKVSIEGDVDRNWDHAYKAAVAEALLWDVDVLLLSGGMKGVTVGSNLTFPSAAAGYGQLNYSLSLFGARAQGITEGKGKAMLSAEAYRYAPRARERRRIPASLYDRIRVRIQPVVSSERSPAPVEPAPAPVEPELPLSEAVAAAICTEVPPAEDSASGCAAQPVPAPIREEPRLAGPAPTCRDASATPLAPRPEEPSLGTAVARPARSRPYTGPGITMSRELFEMAGFPKDQQVGFVNIR